MTVDNSIETQEERLEKENSFKELRSNLIRDVGRIKDLILNRNVYVYTKERMVLGLLVDIESKINNDFKSLDSKWMLVNLKKYIDNIENKINNFHVILENSTSDVHIAINTEISIDRKKMEELLVEDLKFISVLIDQLSSLYNKMEVTQRNLVFEANNKIVEKIENARQELLKEVEDFRKHRHIADNAKTEDIYNTVVKKYRKTEYIYRFLFLLILIGLFIISLILWDTDYVNNIIQQPTYAKSAIFWSVKISTLVAGISLMTYFLKQSAHYQHLADQNYQTQIELQAFPTFMESIPIEEAASIRKELALKYFGRDIDSTPHKDMANLISDQIKNTTEMVKAATDVLKAKSDK
ncbi:hypothetical protein [Acinetobacter sp. ANC 5502]